MKYLHLLTLDIAGSGVALLISVDRDIIIDSCSFLCRGCSTGGHARFCNGQSQGNLTNKQASYLSHEVWPHPGRDTCLTFSRSGTLQWGPPVLPVLYRSLSPCTLASSHFTLSTSNPRSSVEWGEAVLGMAALGLVRKSSTREFLPVKKQLFAFCRRYMSWYCSCRSIIFGSITYFCLSWWLRWTIKKKATGN